MLRHERWQAIVGEWNLLPVEQAHPRLVSLIEEHLAHQLSRVGRLVIVRGACAARRRRAQILAHRRASKKPTNANATPTMRCGTIGIAVVPKRPNASIATAAPSDPTI